MRGRKVPGEPACFNLRQKRMIALDLFCRIACRKKITCITAFLKGNLNKSCFRCHPFFFHCFCICRLGTVKGTGVKYTLTFMFLLVASSLFQRNVRCSEGFLSTTIALLLLGVSQRQYAGHFQQ